MASERKKGIPLRILLRQGFPDLGDPSGRHGRGRLKKRRQESGRGCRLRLGNGVEDVF